MLVGATLACLERLMSNQDSDRPPNPARRLVLRKISTAPPPPPPVPARLPDVRPPPRPSMVSIPPEAGLFFSAPARVLSTPDLPLERVETRPEATSSVAQPPPHVLPGRPPPLRTPPPSRARPSVPPVVATVSSGARDVAPAVPAGTPSARKAGVIGAVLGLSFVALFVVGARLAYRTPAVAAAAASPPAQKTGEPRVLAPPPLESPAPVAALAERPAASIAAPPPPRHVTPAAKPPAPTVAIAKAKVRAADGSPEKGAPTSAGGASGTAAAPGVEPAEDESAQSMTPVIPASPPPEVDPLVKAVLEDDTKK
jgi:hypothetical protein